MKPEYRLPLMIPGGLCVPIGLFWYGWTAEKGVHYVVPIVGTGFVGVGMIMVFVRITIQYQVPNLTKRPIPI